jgi:hypothetical protein
MGFSILKQQLQKEIDQWLPAYAGGLVHGWRRPILRWWLDHDAVARERLAHIKALRREIRRQPQEQPAAAVFLKIQAAIAEEVEPARALRRPVAVWVATVVIALAALLLVWQALPPGISLEWSVQGAQPTTFRVYRAPAADDSAAPSQPFTLLDELQADAATAAYKFTDWLPLPGQNYVYRVEALDQSGQATASQSVIGRGLDALAGQVLTLAALGLLFASMVLIIRGSRTNRSHRSHPVFFQAV